MQCIVHIGRGDNPSPPPSSYTQTLAGRHECSSRAGKLGRGRVFGGGGGAGAELALRL
jgi:hypothetical protein